MAYQLVICAVLYFIESAHGVNVAVHRQHSGGRPAESFWGREINFEPTIDDAGLVRVARSSKKTVPAQMHGTRVMLLGDSTTAILFDELERSQCPRESFVVTNRCDWLTKLGLKPAAEWIKPAEGVEGPVAFGLRSPSCTDCSGCQSLIIGSNASAPGIEIDGACAFQSYIAVEFARDVAMQSERGRTTQESLAAYLREQMPVQDFCVVGEGYHDMAIPHIQVLTYANNVIDFLTLLKPHCRNIIWTELAAVGPRMTEYRQYNEKVMLWNKVLGGKVESKLGHVHWLSLYEPSKRVALDDHIHHHESWYEALADFLFQEMAKIRSEVPDARTAQG